MKRRWIIILATLLIVAGGGYYGYTQFFAPTDEVVEEEEMQTTIVRRSDIEITTGGTGTVLATEEASIAFATGGTLAELNVALGDEVEVGDIIARLEDGELQLAISQAELELTIAEIDLTNATADAEEALASAYGGLADARADLDIFNNTDMTETLINLQETENTYDEAAAELGNSMDPARDWERNIDSERETEQADYDAALNDYTLAQSNYDAAVEGLYDTLNDAEAEVYWAQEELEGGYGDVALAKLALEEAQVALEEAQLALDDLILISPISGTITEVNGTVGETVGTDALVTIVNLDITVVQLYLEEVDLDKATVDTAVEVEFNAWPDQLFEGVVSEVIPTLTDIDGTPAVELWITVNIPDSEATPVFPGMSGEVNVIAGRSEDTLLVPQQALRDLGEGNFAVFVVADSGELELRPVEVGLMDFANAEILSGLEEGEVISTGIVDTEQ